VNKNVPHFASQFSSASPNHVFIFCLLLFSFVCSISEDRSLANKLFFLFVLQYELGNLSSIKRIIGSRYYNVTLKEEFNAVMVLPEITWIYGNYRYGNYVADAPCR